MTESDFCVELRSFFCGVNMSSFKRLAVVFIVTLTSICVGITPPRPYGAYTPAPVPYGYGHTPVYTPQPVSPYHQPVSPYHTPSPPAPYHPSHKAPHKSPAKHSPSAYHGPPKCASHNPKVGWCLTDPEYPSYEIQHAIEYHYEAVQQLYKDVLANTENSVDRLRHLVEEESYLCPSKTSYILPLRAINAEGKWRIIVNGVKAHYETLTQTARIEECKGEGDPCPFVPECYDTKCLQKSAYHRFLVYDGHDQYLPFSIESFKFPASCDCHNGAFVEPPHNN